MAERSSWWAIAVLVALLLPACGPGGRAATESGKQAPPATLSRLVREEDLSTITLTPEAEARLGIKTDVAKRSNVERWSTYAGDVVVKDGRAIAVVAPFAGTLEAAPGKGLPKSGAAVTRGEPLFLLAPLLSPERSVLTDPESVSVGQARSGLAVSKIEASSEVERAAIEVRAARIALERAQKLIAADVGTARAVDEATAALERAEATLRAAQRKEAALAAIVLDSGASAPPGKLAIEAPQDGMVRDLRATAGQTVAAGTVLCRIEALDVVWIRVPVPVGDVARVAAEREARIGPLGRHAVTEQRTAKPVKAPPTADPAANTADLYYEIDNPDFSLRPGQRVGVTIATRATAEAIVVPSSAVLYDIHGGTWVYVNTAPHVFANRRVVVREISSGLAVIERGLDPGAPVVVTGAAELFGTQFGYGK